MLVLVIVIVIAALIDRIVGFDHEQEHEHDYDYDYDYDLDPANLAMPSCVSRNIVHSSIGSAPSFR